MLNYIHKNIDLHYALLFILASCSYSEVGSSLKLLLCVLFKERQCKCWSFISFFEGDIWAGFKVPTGSLHNEKGASLKLEEKEQCPY